jgi:hypothetical protein
MALGFSNAKVLSLIAKHNEIISQNAQLMSWILKLKLSLELSLSNGRESVVNRALDGSTYPG